MRKHAFLLTSVFVFYAVVAPAAVAQSAIRPSSLRINVQNDMPVVGDFTVGPARLVLSMEPGEERTVELEITNREGRVAGFSLSTEDFAADPERESTPTFFASDQEGPYSARAWIEPEAGRFELNHAERAYVRVKVTVPESAAAGDHQAAVIVTRDLGEQQQGGFAIVSRVAALFIITVEGDVVQEGYVDRLDVQSYFNWFFPVFVRLSARNQGTVHMIPTGTIQIRNIFGITVDEIPVKNWLILRDSNRSRIFEWHPRFALGYYRAETDLRAFNGRQLDPVRAGFIVIPLLPVLLLLFIIFLVSFLVQYFSARFEIRRKPDEDEPAPAPVKKPKKVQPKKEESGQ